MATIRTLRQYVAEHTQVRTAQRMGYTQGAVSTALQSRRKIYAVELPGSRAIFLEVRLLRGGSKIKAETLGDVLDQAVREVVPNDKANNAPARPESGGD